MHGRTGVEMEALTAVSVAALTVYDMCKAVDRDLVIGPIQLEEKTGGRRGHFRRPTKAADSLGEVMRETGERGTDPTSGTVGA